MSLITLEKQVQELLARVEALEKQLAKRKTLSVPESK